MTQKISDEPDSVETRSEETHSEGWESLAEDADGSLAANPELEAALREAFSKRVLGGERGAWLFNYDPMTVPLV